MVFIDKKGGKPYLKFDRTSKLSPSSATSNLPYSYVSLNFVLRPTGPNKVFIMRVQTGHAEDIQIWLNKPNINDIRLEPVFLGHPYSEFLSDLKLVPNRFNSLVYYKFPNKVSLYLNGVRSKQNHNESKTFLTFRYLGGSGTFDFSELVAWGSNDVGQQLTNDDVKSLYDDQKQFFGML